MTDEEYVRARWESVGCFVGGVCIVGAGTRLIFNNYAQAREFTEQREKEIAEVEEEIALVSGVFKNTECFASSPYVSEHIKRDASGELPIWKRIMARERAHLDSLTRGMRREK
jgi:hypothetical protein